jgi:hypothetical protein
MSRKKTVPTDRDTRVLDHVERNRITTNQIVRQSCLPELSGNAVRKVTARLCRMDCLHKVEFLQRRSYFTLSARQTRARGLPSAWSLPLGPIALPTEYAVLKYANANDLRRHRLTLRELANMLPHTEPVLLEPAHCLDELETQATIELVRVDLFGKPDHVARKCDRDIRRRRDFGKLDQMISSGRFRLVVITASQQKATAITTSLHRHCWPDGLQIRLAVVSELLHFLER